MSDPKIRTQSTFPTTLSIEGVEIAVRVKRMTNVEFDAFQSGMDRYGDPRGPQRPDETLEARQARVMEADAWIRQVLDAYLAIVPGELEHDGREITRGDDLLDIYGGRVDVLGQALMIVGAENRLTVEQKKTYKSELASFLGFASEPPPAAPGDAPKPIAAAAVPSSSAPAAAATASASPGASSGTTDPSSSEPVPFDRSRLTSRASSDGSSGPISS